MRNLIVHVFHGSDNRTLFLPVSGGGGRGAYSELRWGLLYYQ